MAFEQLLYRYDRQVLNIAYSFRNDTDDAKDIYQEVFMRVYNGLKNFKFKSEFSTWLFRITTNVCISFKNKKDRHTHNSINEEISSDDDEIRTLSDFIRSGEAAGQSAENEEIRNHINRALEKLPAQQKMAFTLKYFEDYKIKEISAMMQCKEGTIKRYIFNATNKLREQLSEILER